MNKRNLIISPLPFFLITIFLLSACSSTSNKKSKEKSYQYASMQDGILHLDIDKARKDSAILNLSQICDSLIYIPLETKKECLLSNRLRRLCIDGDDIFMQVRVSAYHFKTSGKFVCQLGKKGRGPGEYTCTGLTVNPDKKRVYAYANFKHNVFEYDYDGNLISDKIKLSSGKDILYNPYTKSMFYTSLYNFSLEMSKDTEYNVLSEYDLEGELKSNIKSKYFPNQFFLGNKGGNIFINGASTYLTDNALCFQEVSSDTVFRKTVDAIKPYIVLNNKDFKKPLNSETCVAGKKSSVWYFLKRDKEYPCRVCGESSRYVFVDSYSDPAYVYDRQERKLSCVEPYVEYSEGEKPGEKVAQKYVYHNDIDGLNHIVYTSVVDNKYLLSFISAVDLLESLENLKESKTSNTKYIKHLEKIAKGLTEESNPVLMLARLKK